MAFNNTSVYIIKPFIKSTHFKPKAYFTVLYHLMFKTRTYRIYSETTLLDDIYPLSVSINS
jgi:hypothetical protein